MAAIACVTLWVHLFEFTGANTADAALYLTMGKLLQRGLLLYRDLWETKPPGLFMYYGAVFALLPVEVWSLRFTDYALYVATGVVFYRLCAFEARWLLALAGTALWLYFAHHPSFNNQGFYTEEYASMSAVGAVAAAARYWRGGRLRWAMVSGGALAGAIVLKHPGAACAVPAMVLISGRRPLRVLFLFAVSAVLPLVLVVTYFWWRGTLTDFLDCNFYMLLGYSGLNRPSGVSFVARLGELARHTWEQFAPYPELAWPVVFGALLCLVRPTRLRVAAVAWLLADLFMVGLQGHYYEHQFIQVFPSAVLTSVFGAAWLLQRRAGERWYVAVPRLACCIGLVALAVPRLHVVIEQRQPVVEQAWATLRAGPSAWPRRPGGSFEADLGRYLNERTAVDDRLFVYDTGTAVALYWTADRLPASRYLWPDLQWNLSPKNQQWADLELARNRPAYVLVTGDLGDRPITPMLRAGYTLETTQWGAYRVEVWRRNDLAPPGAAAAAPQYERRPALSKRADIDRGGRQISTAIVRAHVPTRPRRDCPFMCGRRRLPRPRRAPAAGATREREFGVHPTASVVSLLPVGQMPARE